MKKFVKVSMLCLALVLLMPLALVGCSKNYTITISIAEGMGNVYFAHDGGGTRVDGENAVEGGSKFEYLVSPATGYYLSKVVVDGKVTTYTQEEAVFSDHNSNGEEIKTRSKYLYFDNIKADHKVSVYFSLLDYEIRLMVKAENEDIPVLWKTVKVKFNSSINLNLNEYGGNGNNFWYLISSSQNHIYLVNGKTDPAADPLDDPSFTSNVITIGGPDEVITYYCDKTKTELEAHIAGLGE